MAALDTTAFAYALKQLYTKKKIQNMVYQDNPWLAMCPKWEGFEGSNFTEAVVYSDIAGRSYSFSDAQANKVASAGKAFLVTRARDYGLASIDTETILASKSNEGALLSAVKREMDSTINALKRSMAIDMYRDGTGHIGTVGAVSTGVITLDALDDVTNFEVGQSIVAAESTTDAIRSGTGVVTVVDRDLGKVTYSGTITSIEATDFLFTEGDYTDTTTNKISGLSAWIPAAAPVLSSDSFFGVDRGSDPTRLGGLRVVGTSLNIEEAIKKGAYACAREGGRPDCCFISFEQFDALTNLLGSKVNYVDHKVGEVGFQGVRIYGPKGAIEVYPDQNCQGNIAWILTKDSWVLRSLGPAPRILDLDGNKMLREASADAYEVRMAFWGNLCCNAPGHNARVSLTAIV